MICNDDRRSRENQGEDYFLLFLETDDNSRGDGRDVIPHPAQTVNQTCFLTPYSSGFSSDSVNLVAISLCPFLSPSLPIMSACIWCLTLS